MKYFCKKIPLLWKRYICFQFSMTDYRSIFSIQYGKPEPIPKYRVPSTKELLDNAEGQVAVLRHKLKEEKDTSWGINIKQ